MRQIKQMPRLAHDGGSSREIGRTLGIARSTVQDNLFQHGAAHDLRLRGDDVAAQGLRFGFAGAWTVREQNRLLGSASDLNKSTRSEDKAALAFPAAFPTACGKPTER